MNTPQYSKNGSKNDAIDIWNAGVAAVDGQRAATAAIVLGDKTLTVGGGSFELSKLRQIMVVGFGKCSGAMAVGVEHALRDLPREISLSGLVNVPAGQSNNTQIIELAVCRDRASNFPTEAVVEQTRRMLEMLLTAGEQTLVIALISGGGSALLEDPRVPLEDLVAVSKSLSNAGASIESLNTVRRALSGVKAGGLATHLLRHTPASLIGLAISDVIGDSLAVVASGPTILSSETEQQKSQAAMEVLQKFDLTSGHDSVLDYLQNPVQPDRADWTTLPNRATLLSTSDTSSRINNILLANNATAVAAAKAEAKRRGYALLEPPFDVNRDVEKVADDWVALVKRAWRDGLPTPTAILAGGEPTVKLCGAPGIGGRNLQLTGLILQRLSNLSSPTELSNPTECDASLTFLSGGSDGEDGTSPMAGGWFDSQALKALADDATLGQKLSQAIANNDCHTFFERTGNLLTPPPVSTNVCDIQVMLIRCPALRDD